jgi:uncharacterized membrane protein YphA (DoxX/SURF4 family)
MLPFDSSGRAAAISVRQPAQLAPATSVHERWHELRAQLARPALAFDLLRVYVGLGLMIRGALFAREPALLEHFIDHSSWLFTMVLAHALVLSHVVGGLMLALGCCTRWAAAVQIPFVATALFFLHWHEGLLARTQSVEFAALVLFTLILYLACGAGHFSIDYYLQREPAEVATGEPALSLQRSLEQPYASMPVADTPRVTDSVQPGTKRCGASADVGRADLRTELADGELDVPPDAAYVREQYRDVKRELTILLVGSCLLFVLLAAGLYLAAAAWFMGAMVLFVIWRIGQAHFE